MTSGSPVEARGADVEAVRAPCSASSERPALVLLALLTAFALGVRLWCLDALLPHLSEPDGDMVIQAMLLQTGDPRPGENSNWASYPHLLPRIASWVPIKSAGDPAGSPARAPATLAEHLEAAARPHLVMRAVVALLSVLLVPATYFLARAFCLTPAWSLCGAALVATSLLLLNGSQQARPHAPAAGIAVTAVLAALNLRRRPTLGAYALAGTLAALAIGALQFGVFVLPSLLAAHLLRDRSTPGAARGRGLAGAALATLILALSIPAFHGYLFSGPWDGPNALFDWRTGEIRTAEHVILLDLSTEGLRVLAHGLWSYDPALFFLVALGLPLGAFALVLRRKAWPAGRGRDLLVVAAHALPFLFAIGCFNRAYPRFLSPLLPHCACLAVLALRASAALLTRWLPDRSASPVFDRVGARAAAAGILSLGALALPTYACLRSAWLRSQPDSTELLADWIQRHPAASDTPAFVSTSFDVPLVRRDPQSLAFLGADPIDHSYPWWRYQLDHQAELAAVDRYDISWYLFPREPTEAAALVTSFASRGGGLVVIEVHTGGIQDPSSPFRMELRARSQAAVRFGPVEDERARPRKLSYDHSGIEGSSSFFDFGATYLARVLAAERLGPVLEVYRL